MCGVVCNGLVVLYCDIGCYDMLNVIVLFLFGSWLVMFGYMYNKSVGCV